MGLDSTGSSPVFPIKVFQHPLSQLFNQFSLAHTSQFYYFDTRITTRTIQILQILKSYNQINLIHKIQNKLYRIYPHYTKFRRRKRNVKTFFRINNNVSISLKALQITTKNTKYCHFVLETSFGIIDHKKALKKKTGGKLIMIIS